MDEQRAPQMPGLGVVIATYERPGFLRRCLTALLEQAEDLREVVVVDASVAASTVPELVHPLVAYRHRPDLAGWMTRSRNAALYVVTSDVISFLDDDVVVRPGWAAALRRAFLETGAAAVAGRTCNGIPGEENYGLPIGAVLPNGTLTDGFASNVSDRSWVDHGIGANMAFRRDVLARLGGFRDDYPGTALREDTDIFLRVKALGGMTVFDPSACVDHLPAPHVKGRRFDTRYKLYGRRNHVVLLGRNFGAGSSVLWRWIGSDLRKVKKAGGLRGKVLRLGVSVAGVAWGLGALPTAAHWRALAPERDDRTAREIRSHLSDH